MHSSFITITILFWAYLAPGLASLTFLPSSCDRPACADIRGKNLKHRPISTHYRVTIYVASWFMRELIFEKAYRASPLHIERELGRSQASSSS